MKILQQLTVIPKELYVERSADRQVESILESMGRPGYVLVARQMGKTNLLLNAKDKAKLAGDIFTYLDATNELPDIREFFRNIIDLTLATATASPEVEIEINQARATQQRLPHKEHEWELRCILRNTRGKFIVCLDEIDALTRTDYSDQVFSFIRSVYFSGRANFPEFSRLTYLLSGVAEPADIIKNKDISPFNIGEKIYLEDFSLSETKELIQRANVVLDSGVAEHLYSWISGYPRMTWDVCSALEDSVQRGVRVTSSEVDSFVRKIYFSEVDAPPIDHIKRLVEESTSLQDAVISIHYNRSESVPDSVRTKLYLAGITKMIPQGKKLQFKNRVLEESLSEGFVHSLTRRSYISQISAASQKINFGDFAAAFKELGDIQDLAIGDERKRIAYLRGICQFKVAEFDGCIKSFEALSVDNTDPRLAAEICLYVGISRARLGLYAEAASALAAVANSELPARFEAQVELAEVWLRSRGDIATAEQWCMRLVSEPSLVGTEHPLTRSVAEVLAGASIFLAELAHTRRNLETARKHLESALNYATTELKVRIYLLFFDMDGGPRRAIYLKQCFAFIKGCDSFVTLADGLQNSVSIHQLCAYLTRAEHAGRSKELADGIESAYTQRISGLTPEEVVDYIAAFAMDRGSNSLALKVLERAIVDEDTAISPTYRRQLIGSAMVLAPKKIGTYVDAYLRTFSASHQPSITDFSALVSLLIHGSALLSSSVSDQVIDIFNREPIESASILTSERQSLDIVRQYAICYRALRGASSSGDVALARSVMSKMAERRSLDLPNFNGNQFRLMQTAMYELLKRFGPVPSVKRGRKIGRNDIIEVDYQGTVRKGKFKKFEGDLETGACKLVGRVENSA